LNEGQDLAERCPSGALPWVLVWPATTPTTRVRATAQRDSEAKRLRRLVLIPESPRMRLMSLSPEQLLQDVARLDALAITAAEQTFKDLFNILGLDTFGDLPDRFGDLVLSRQADSRLFPRPLDAQRNLDVGEIDHCLLGAAAGSKLRAEREVEGTRREI